MLVLCSGDVRCAESSELSRVTIEAMQRAGRLYLARFGSVKLRVMLGC
jgi:hypothetical protein